MPESPLGTAVLGLVVVWWALALDDVDGVPVEVLSRPRSSCSPRTCSAVVLSYGPAGMPLDAAVLRRWLRRGPAARRAAPLVWLVAVAVDGQPEPPGIWVAGLAAAVVVCVVAATAVACAEDEG